MLTFPLNKLSDETKRTVLEIDPNLERDFGYQLDSMYEPDMDSEGIEIDPEGLTRMRVTLLEIIGGWVFINEFAEAIRTEHGLVIDESAIG